MKVFFPGGLLPNICLIGICRPKLKGNTWFLLRFGLEACIDLAQFGLNSGIVFEGIRECMDLFVVSISNE